jgi:oligopeptide/dipeptide ABC transporter ATP-binding protein
MSKATIMRIEGLTVEYATRSGPVTAVDDVDLDIRRGEILGLVGESGCGKSTLGRALMRLVDPPGRITSGSIIFDGTDLIGLSRREMRQLRGTRIGMVFQDPMTSLVPIEKVATQISHTVRSHDRTITKQEIVARAAALAERLGIRAERLQDYPHQLSGGMRQRIMIAIAMILDAELVIADEPTTALDVIVEAQFLDLLKELTDEFEVAILLITHNIGVVAQVADRVAVMYAGRIVEIGPVEMVFGSPQHPYTQGLLRSVPTIDMAERELYKMAGLPPNLSDLPSGCAFHPRCEYAMDICRQRVPPLTHQGEHASNCWLHVDFVEKST